MRTFLSLLAFFGLWLTAAPASLASDKKDDAPKEVSMAQRLLEILNQREQEAYQRYEKAITEQDIKKIKADLQSIVDAYDKLIAQSPNYAPAYVSYGMMLSRIGERNASYAMFAKADELDPGLAVVKNQLGNFLAENGDFVEAMGYYLMAMELEPAEPLYQLQLGNLLLEYRKFFIAEGMYDQVGIDSRIQQYFKNAANLAPNDTRYRFRYAQSFFEVENADWNKALEEWHAIMPLAGDDLEKQIVKLYTARVRLELGHHSAARKLLKQIDAPELQKNRLELIDRLDSEFGR